MRRFRTAVTIALGVGIAAVLLAACSSSSPSASNTGNGTKVSGGTVTWAEPPSDVPNYIFPFMSLAFFSVTNLSQFQQLMYRPLYWFGQGSTPNLNHSVRWPRNPVYSADGKTVTIDLNNYKWSNGETVTAQDVVFWMNMMIANKTIYGAYVPGINAIPDNVTNVVATSPTAVTFTLNGIGEPELVHLQPAVADHPDAGGLGHHCDRWGSGFRRLLQRRRLGRPSTDQRPA